MLRHFDDGIQRVLGIGSGTRGEIPYFHIEPNATRSNEIVYMGTSTIIKPNSDWLTTRYVVDTETGLRYCEVSTNTYVRFISSDNLERPSHYPEYQMAVSKPLSNNFNVAVANKGNYYNNGYQPHTVAYFDGRGNVGDAGYYNDGSEFVADRSVEVAQNQRRWFGFEVTTNRYYYYDDLLLHSSLINVSTTENNPNVQPIDKIIVVSSTMPDIFDSNSNAVNYTLDCGQKIRTNGVFTDGIKAGYRLANNTYISLDSASGTPLLYGNYRPDEYNQGK